MDGGESAFFVAGHDGQRCRIVLPLALSERHGLRRIGWLGQAESDYNAPLFDPDLIRALSEEDVRRLWRDAARLAGGADVVFARKQPAAIAGIENPFSAVACGPESDRAHLRNLVRPWPVVETELSSAKSRRRLREKHRALEKLGAVEIRAVSEPGEIRLCAEKLMDWKSEQLDQSGATNPFADAAYRRFFHSICARGVAGLHGVFIDAAPVAVTCLLADANGWTLYQTGFDRAYSRHSPGRILNLALLKRASEAGARFFDFGYGDEDYKRSMCNRSLDLTYSIIALSPRGAVAALALRAAMATRRAVKKNPRLRRVAFFLNRLF